MSILPETKEQYSSQIPALKTLLALGWKYLSPAACLKKRGGHRSVMLKDELIESLKKRRFEYKGEQYPLSPNAIEQIVRELSSPGLNEGLLTASERIYDKLCLGVTVTEFIDGKKYLPTIPIIEWDEITNNSFLVTEEMKVLSTAGTHTRRPDLVCFVNGLPLVVIEAKRPDSVNPRSTRVSASPSATRRVTKSLACSFMPNCSWPSATPMDAMELPGPSGNSGPAGGRRSLPRNTSIESKTRR